MDLRFSCVILNLDQYILGADMSDDINVWPQQHSGIAVFDNW